MYEFVKKNSNDFKNYLKDDNNALFTINDQNKIQYHKLAMSIITHIEPLKLALDRINQSEDKSDNDQNQADFVIVSYILDIFNLAGDKSEDNQKMLNDI